MKLSNLFTFKSRHEKAAESFRPQLAKIAAEESRMQSLSDEALKQVVVAHKGQTLEQMRPHLVEIFAAIREAGRRTLAMRHFDVQMLGGFVLLDGAIAEMKTGEGKTLVATLPLIVHGLAGKGAHLVTVNEYLSGRDAEWMRPLYEFFDLTVGAIAPGMSPAEKREAYAADITYGTNNEFGFDYLRDNMAQHVDAMTQRGLAYALIDEVDSILIDEARTPLIISAPDTESTQLYPQFARIAPQLKENTHYNIDEKRKAITLTDEGISQVEQLLGIDNIYHDKGIRFVHHLEQALRAHALYHRDRDYVVREGQVMIVDEFTGRLMEGRRYSEGLHQAIEAKEQVAVQQESRTLATITFQNFFRLYPTISGMTGTAVTSAEEFEKVYNLDVAVIPTNKSLARVDKTDRIYVNEQAKFAACVAEIKKRYEAGQPVLVGTVAIQKSEYLATLLQQAGIPHEVLNAKHHEREADIIAQAGQAGSVTISTNMAGRGTDIKLGEGVAEKGGLFVLGTERHEARRIDNQLRGRSGRQGDPGETQFFISLEDEVMRVFGGQRLQSLMKRLKVPENEPIENSLVTRAIEGAQERVEGYYFDMRKQVLAYDDVLNRQRNAIYTLRRGILEAREWREVKQQPKDLSIHTRELVAASAQELAQIHTASDMPEEWNVHEIAESVHSLTGTATAEVEQKLQAAVAAQAAEAPEAAREALSEVVATLLLTRLDERIADLGTESFEALERAATLRSIDTLWMDHLDTMDYLRTGIGLRGYGQRDPLVEYQKEAYQLFQTLLRSIDNAIVETLFHAEAVREEAPTPGVALHAPAERPAKSPEGGSADISGASQNPGSPLQNPYKNVGRNDLCPCGSGKKFKRCHGS